MLVTRGLGSFTSGLVTFGLGVGRRVLVALGLAPSEESIRTIEVVSTRVTMSFGSVGQTAITSSKDFYEESIRLVSSKSVRVVG